MACVPRQVVLWALLGALAFQGAAAVPPLPAIVLTAVEHRQGGPGGRSAARPGPGFSDKELAALLAELKSKDPLRMVKATDRLREVEPGIPDPAVEQALAEVLLDEAAPAARTGAAKTLAKWGTRASLPALEKASVYAGGGHALSIQARKAVDAIRQREGIGGVGPEPVQPSVRTPPAPAWAVQAAAPAAGFQATDAGIQALVADLGAGDKVKVIRAVNLLVIRKPAQPDRTVANALVKAMLESGEIPVRLNASRALAAWGDASDLPALEKMLADPAKIVQAGARQSIDRIKARKN